MNRKKNGFTLIELLIVVAIIGVIAAIAIPNLIQAVQRAKQKRTMADMKAIATAWEARATDLNRYNAAGIVDEIAQCNRRIDHVALSGALSPTYIKLVPVLDGWSHPMRMYADQDWNASTPSQWYLIWSGGKDATTDSNAATGFDTSAPGGATTNFNDDILFSNGVFVQYPEGVQSQ